MEIKNFRNIDVNISTPIQLWNPLFYNMSDTEKFSIQIFQDKNKPVNFTASKSYGGIVERNGTKKRLFSQESSKFFSSLKVEIDNGIYKGSGTYTLLNKLSNTANEIEFKSDLNI